MYDEFISYEEYQRCMQMGLGETITIVAEKNLNDDELESLKEALEIDAQYPKHYKLTALGDKEISVECFNPFIPGTGL